MMKYILLIALLFHGDAMAHEWKQDYWLETLMRNHVKVVACWLAVNQNDIITFRKDCSLWSIGYTENKLMTQYHAARAQHPGINQLEFFTLHFPNNTDEETWQINQNMALIVKVDAIIVAMHIAEGLSRDDK